MSICANIAVTYSHGKCWRAFIGNDLMINILLLVMQMLYGPELIFVKLFFALHASFSGNW